MGNVTQFIQAHPLLAVVLALVTIFALVGLWYVVSYHLREIVTAVVCIVGAASGAVVFWRGATHDLIDLVAIGGFMLLIFPVILYQAIQRPPKSIAVPLPKVPGIVLKPHETGGKPH